MKEKNQNTLLKNNERNLWMGTIQSTLLTMMEECEHRPVVTYDSEEGSGKKVSKDDLRFILGFLSLMEGYLTEQDCYNELLDEIKLLNENMENIVTLSDEIIHKRKISKNAREQIKNMKNTLDKFFDIHGFNGLRLIGDKLIDMDLLNTRDLEYFTTVKEYLRGFVFRDLYKLKPEAIPHG